MSTALLSIITAVVIAGITRATAPYFQRLANRLQKERAYERLAADPAIAVGRKVSIVAPDGSGKIIGGTIISMSTAGVVCETDDLEVHIDVRVFDRAIRIIEATPA